MPFMELALLDYEDRDVLEWIKFGFSIARNDSCPDPIPATDNHRGATEFPDTINNNIQKEHDQQLYAMGSVIKSTGLIEAEDKKYPQRPEWNFWVIH